MEPTLAQRVGPDPRKVVTPISASKTEQLLRTYGIYDNWKHILVGLVNGFDVGIKHAPERTIIFRKSQILQTRYPVHRQVHTKRMRSRQVLVSIRPTTIRATNRPVPDLTIRAGTQTGNRSLPHDTRPVVPTKQPAHSIYQQRGQCGRFPNWLGHFRRNGCHNPITSARLSSSCIRHISSIQNNTSESETTELTLHSVARVGVCRPRGNVRIIFKRWGIWGGSGHAGGHWQGGWFPSNTEVGRRLPGDSIPRPRLDGTGFHRPYSRNRSTMECLENKTPITPAKVHRLYLGPKQEDSHVAAIKNRHTAGVTGQLARQLLQSHDEGGFQPARKISACGKHSRGHTPLPEIHQPFRSILSLAAGTPTSTSKSTSRFVLGTQSACIDGMRTRLIPSGTRGHWLVGRRQHVLWHRSSSRDTLGRLEMEEQCPNWPREEIRHWLGRGCGSRTWSQASATHPQGTLEDSENRASAGAIGQHGGCRGSQPRALTECKHEPDPPADIRSSGVKRHQSQGRACHIDREYRRQPITGHSQPITLCHWVGNKPDIHSATIPPTPTFTTVVWTLRASNHAVQSEISDLRDSPLRPNCRANERITRWIGTRRPPDSTLNTPGLRRMAFLASEASIKDASSYGAGIRKFHVFCDAYSVPEEDRLPASFALLHSFILWAAADPDDPLTKELNDQPVAVVTVRKYLSAIRAWHIAQGWPAPLRDDDIEKINWTLRGLQRMQAGRRTKPPRPPVTLRMLRALKRSLDPASPFEACMWAIATCAFWGMMRFGETTVRSRAAFSPMLHIARRHVIFDRDLTGKPYARLDLPAAKTAAPGEIQHIFLTEQGDLCPLQALVNLLKLVEAGPEDPLFAWTDSRGSVRPMTRDAAMKCVNSIFTSFGWGTAFGHSFRIGGASHYLAQGVNPEIVRIAGRWKSLAYETYIRSFELVANRHLGSLENMLS